MLTINTEYRKGILFVRLNGVLNKDTIDKLNKKVTDVVIKNGIRNIVFNFEKLRGIDIKGINSIFYNYELCKNKRGKSFICGNNDNIRNKLKHSRLINYIYEISDEISAFSILNY